MIEYHSPGGEIKAQAAPIGLPQPKSGPPFTLLLLQALSSHLAASGIVSIRPY